MGLKLPGFMIEPETFINYNRDSRKTSGSCRLCSLQGEGPESFKA